MVTSMAKDREKGARSGCFTWVVSLKKAINKRCAAARNVVTKRFRKKYADKQTKDLVNDTGCPDLVFTKTLIARKPDLNLKRSVRYIHRLVTEADEQEFDGLETVTLNNGGVAFLVPVETKPEAEVEAATSWTSTTDSGISEVAVKGSLTSIDTENESTAPESVTSSSSNISDIETVALSNGGTAFLLPVAYPPDVTKLEAEVRASTSMTSTIVSGISDVAVKGSLSSIATEKEPSGSASESITSRSSVVSDISKTSFRTSLISLIANINESALARDQLLDLSSVPIKLTSKQMDFCEILSSLELIACALAFVAFCVIWLQAGVRIDQIYFILLYLII